VNNFAEVLTPTQGFYCVFSLRFTNDLVFLFLSFQVPFMALWLIMPRGCNKERCVAEDKEYFSPV
jgi:hypothetical protein